MNDYERNEDNDYYYKPEFKQLKADVLKFVKAKFRTLPVKQGGFRITGAATVGDVSRHFKQHRRRGWLWEVIDHLEADGEVTRAMKTAQITELYAIGHKITPDGKRTHEEMNLELSRHFAPKIKKIYSF